MSLQRIHYSVIFSEYFKRYESQIDSITTVTIPTIKRQKGDISIMRNEGQFQFYIVRLKVHNLHKNFDDTYLFQFYIVRLKDRNIFCNY